MYQSTFDKIALDEWQFFWQVFGTMITVLAVILGIIAFIARRISK